MSGEQRIAPVDPERAPAELGSLGTLNIFRTFARHPELFRSWLPFGRYLLAEGSLPAADRELMILRTAERCGCSYEWGQHVRIALDVGVDRAAIDRVLEGPDAEGWTQHQAALLRAVDELHESSTLSDETWAQLAETYDDRLLMEATMLIGQYHLVAFALNAFGVELDEGLEQLPLAGA